MWAHSSTKQGTDCWVLLNMTRLSCAVVFQIKPWITASHTITYDYTPRLHRQQWARQIQRKLTFKRREYNMTQDSLLLTSWYQVSIALDKKGEKLFECMFRIHFPWPVTSLLLIALFLPNRKVENCRWERFAFLTLPQTFQCLFLGAE